MCHPKECQYVDSLVPPSLLDGIDKPGATKVEASFCLEHEPLLKKIDLGISAFGT